jgi:hypothetical protein
LRWQREIRYSCVLAISRAKSRGLRGSIAVLCGRERLGSAAASANSPRNRACWRDSASCRLYQRGARHLIGLLPPAEFLPGRADIAVTFVIIGKVVAREGAVAAPGFVEDGDVRLDPALLGQSVQHLGRPIGAVANQTNGIKLEALHRPLDHSLGSEDGGSPSWPRHRR